MESIKILIDDGPGSGVVSILQVLNSSCNIACSSVGFCESVDGCVKQITSDSIMCC